MISKKPYLFIVVIRSKEVEVIRAKGCSWVGIHTLCNGLRNLMEFLNLDSKDLENDLLEKKDEDILNLSIKNPSVFEILIDRYQEAFVRKALTILHSREESEDIVQETFAKIYINADKFKKQEGASFKSWAYKILINTSFTRYQKIKRERGSRIDLDPEIYESFGDFKSKQFEKQEVSEYVLSILSKMPDHLSRVLKLHVLEGKSQKEVAKEEGISVSAVKTRIHRAKKAFKKINIALI